MELPISRSVVSSLKGKLFGKQQQQVEDAPQVNTTCVMKSKERSIKRILGYPQNNLLVSFHDMRVIRIWDILAGECLHSIDTNHSKVSIVHGDLLFVACTDNSLNVVKVYDFKTYDLVGILEGHSSWISRIMVEDNHVITASNDGTARLYNLCALAQSQTLGECIHVPCNLVMTKHASAVASTEIFENYVFTAGSDGTIMAWNMKIEDNQSARNTEVEVYPDKVFDNGHKRVIFGLKIYKNFLYSASLDQSIRVWNIQNGKCSQQFHLEDVIPDFRVDFRIMIEDTAFPVSNQDFQIHQFNLKTGKVVRTFAGHTGEVRAMCLSESNEYLYSGSADRTIRKWDIKSGNCASIFRGHIEEVNTLCIFAGYLYSGAEDGTVREWPNVEEHSEIFHKVQRSPTSQIDLSYSKLSSLPNFLVKLPKIDVLYLNYNHLARLPTDICQLTNLKALNLDHNYFTQFPNALGLLPNLRQLYLEHNNLTHISRVALENLTNLEMLYLGNNNITELPPNLCGLTNLQRLCVSNNRLQSIPPIGTLTNLNVLKLDNNQLKTLPSNMANLVKLTSLSLNNNPLEIPSECLVSVEAVFFFLTYSAKPDSNTLVDLEEVASSQNRLPHPSRADGDITRRPPSGTIRKKLPPIPPKRPHQEKAPPQQLIRKSGVPNSFYTAELGKTRDDSYLNMTSPDVSRDRKNHPTLRDSMSFSKPLPHTPPSNNNNNAQPRVASPGKPLPPPPRMRTITLGAVPLTKSASVPPAQGPSRTSPVPFSPPSPVNSLSSPVPTFSNQLPSTSFAKPLPQKPLPPKPPKPPGLSLSAEDYSSEDPPPRKGSVDSAEIPLGKSSSVSDEESSLSAPTSRRPSTESPPHKKLLDSDTTETRPRVLVKGHTAIGLMTEKAPPPPAKPLPPPPKMRAITFSAIPGLNPQAQQQIMQQEASKAATAESPATRRLSRTNSDKMVSKNAFITKDRKSVTIDTDRLDLLKQEIKAKENPDIVMVEIKHGNITDFIDVPIPTEPSKFELVPQYQKVELADIKQKINQKLNLAGEDSFNLMFWDSIETEWKWLESNSVGHFFSCEHRTLFVLLEST